MKREQVRWQCRRGMLELDLMLLKFFDDRYDGLSGADQQGFIRLLQEPDQTLYRWLTGQELPVEPELGSLATAIRHYLWKP